jgi:hypothetical protein
MAPRPPRVYTDAELIAKKKRMIQRAKAAQIERFKSEYGVTTKSQRNALAVKNSHFWLLQGFQLVQNGSLIEDIFYQISSHLLKLPINKTKFIFDSVHDKYLNDKIIKIDKDNTKWFGLFRNDEKANAKKIEAKNQSENRKKLK